ncbi:hypothetical protein BX600DRAFT_540208 [Xylariales sp. PMI_506]|nr:hypothetical protein BX600DRAFT_540208 [Xylariales sp. PMI_506]
MSRYIDQIPRPKQPRQDVGHFNAIEAFSGGPHQIKLLNNALEPGLYNGRGGPFGKAEFDKWFGDHDLFPELNWANIWELMQGHLRDALLHAQSGSRGISGCPSATGGAHPRFSGPLLEVYNPILLHGLKDGASRVAQLLVDKVTDGKGPTPEGEEALKQYYINYLAEIKRVVPPERLHVVQLEDGLGWEQICPLLGLEVPSKPWPMRHTVEDFEVSLAGPMHVYVKAAMVKAFRGLECGDSVAQVGIS